MSTKLFRAAFKLSANFRWCLTGTPIQNRLEDIGFLLAFLRIAPFEDVFEFRRHIIAPIMNGTGRGTHNLRLLLDSVCLRRTKVLLDLPDLVDEADQNHSTVFSCWTRSLDLVEKLFAVRRIRYARLDGSHSTYQRQQVLDDFDSDPNLRVLIMTTGTGAVG